MLPDPTAPQPTPNKNTSSKGVSRRAAARLRGMGPENFPALPSARPVQSRTTKPPNGSRSSYLDVARSRGVEASAREVGQYANMLLDPFSRESACRYPDETIVPTAMTHLTSSATYSVGSSGTVLTLSRWKVTSLATTTVPTIYTPGALSTTPGVGPTSSDYGGPQDSWLALNAIDRTLAFGIRVRVVGLPTSTFLPSGTLYCLQIQEAEVNSIITALISVGESAAIQAITAGKGFSMTVNELSKLDGATVPFLPQGPMSFVFSDKNSVPAAGAGSGFAPSTVVSANPVILVVGYGMSEGQQLRFDYAHHVEYIPTIQAAGLVATHVQPPSSSAREGIARASAMVQDKLAGATRGSEVASVVSNGSLGSFATSLGRAAIGLIPGASALVGAASGLSSVLGAPSWLTSALSALS